MLNYAECSYVCSVIILKNIMLSFKASSVHLVKEMRLFLKQLEIEFSLKLFDLNLVNFVRQNKSENNLVWVLLENDSSILQRLQHLKKAFCFHFVTPFSRRRNTHHNDT
jgi:hypothetical protein